MSAEHRLIHASTEASPIKEKSTRSCVFIPGMQANHSGMRAEFGINKALQRFYGKDKVLTFNSIVSTDSPFPKRFAFMADKIMAKAAEGPLDIAVHSLGATELRKVIKAIKKKNKNFFKNPELKKNLRFILIGPSGFNKSALDKLKYARNIARINGKKEKGFETLDAFRPTTISSGELSLIFRADSNKREGVAVYQAKNNQENVIFLSSKLRKALADHDKELAGAIKKNDTHKASQLVKKRAEDAAESLQQVFEGAPMKRKGKAKTQIGGVAGLGVLLEAAGSKPMRTLRKLADEGYQVDFLVPEFDFIVPIDKIEKFNKKQNSKKARLAVVETSSHPGFGLQAKHYGEIIFSSRKQALAESADSNVIPLDRARMNRAPLRAAA